MIGRKDCEEFLNQNVGIGVTNFRIDGIFFYYGILLEVNDECVKLRTGKGFKQINLDDVIEIKKARW